VYEPSEQFSLLELGYGVTNAARRTTPGSGDLRRGDFDGTRLERIAAELDPVAIAFVGKEAYRGSFNERPEHGPQWRTLGPTALYVLPSTSPANAAVPWDERLHWFLALHEWLEPTLREAVRGLVVDARNRVLLVRFRNPVTEATWWGTPGGGIEEGESHAAALRRELVEEIGLETFTAGPLVWSDERAFPWAQQLYRQRNNVYLVRVEAHEPRPTVDLSDEGIAGMRWWTLDELAATEDRLAPRDIVERVRTILGA